MHRGLADRPQLVARRRATPSLALTPGGGQQKTMEEFRGVVKDRKRDGGDGGNREGRPRGDPTEQHDPLAKALKGRSQARPKAIVAPGERFNGGSAAVPGRPASSQLRGVDRGSQVEDLRGSERSVREPEHEKAER